VNTFGLLLVHIYVENCIYIYLCTIYAHLAYFLLQYIQSGSDVGDGYMYYDIIDEQIPQ